MDLIEGIIATCILYLIINFMNKFLPEESQIPKKVYKRSSLVSCLIIFGIIFGIQVLFGIIGYWVILFRVLSNNQFLFAIMATIFFPLIKFFLSKFDKSRSLNDNPKFKRRLKIFIGITWIVGLIFISFDFLGIELIWERYPYPPKYDIFYLTLVWTLFAVIFNIALIYLITMTMSIEKRLPKEELRNALIAAGFITFVIYFIQLLIFEMYLNRVFGLEIIIQDIRVLQVVVTSIYIVIFFNLLRVKFLPESAIGSQKKVQAALKEEGAKILQNPTFSEDKINLNIKELNSNLLITEDVTYSIESVSLKSYIFLSNKFGRSRSLRTLLHEESNIKKLNYILVGLLWAIALVMTSIKLFLISIDLNLVLDVLLLSFQCAFFMTLIDIAFIFLFNKLIPVENRIQKRIFKKTILFGGIFSFWIWTPLLLLIYLYFFIWISEIVFLNISFITIFSIIIFAIGANVIRRYARMKNWADSKRKTIIISLISLIINIPLVILYTLFSKPAFTSDPSPSFLIFLLVDCLITGIFVTSIVIMIIYSKAYFESLKFIIVIQLIIYFAVIVIGYVLVLADHIITSLHYNIRDIRVPLIVISSIYLVSFLGSLRLKPLKEIPKESKFPEELLLIEEEPTRTQISEEREVILDVKDLTTYFYTEEGVVRAVEGVSFKIYEGEVLGLVGETGCGKSVTALSILQVVRPPGKIERGKVIFREEDLLQKSETEMLKYRGKDITMIFQDPLNSINPVFKIGAQISEVFLIHMENELLIEASKYPDKSTYSVAREWSEKLLRDLNIPFPEIVYDRYPHELSGGMRQRVQIAMGLACNPKLLIADEPTTALDVTVQNQILKLMKELKKKYNTSILFITHDLGIISKMCNRVAVMYSGFIVEYGEIRKLFSTPYHPYTRGLLISVPVVGTQRNRLEIIPGTVPNLIYPPSGCRFHPRCQYCFEPCDSKIPKSIEVENEYFVACHLYDPQYKSLAEISIKNAEKKKVNMN